MDDRQDNAGASAPEAIIPFPELKREFISHAVAGWGKWGYVTTPCLKTLIAHHHLPFESGEALASPEKLQCVLTILTEYAVTEGEIRKWHSQKPEPGDADWLFRSWQHDASLLFLKRAPLQLDNLNYQEAKHALERNAATIENIRQKLANIQRLKAEIRPLALELGQQLITAEVVSFGEFTDTMVSTFGTSIRPYLRDYYETLAVRPQNQNLPLSEPDYVESISAVEVPTNSEARWELLRQAAEAGEEFLQDNTGELEELIIINGLPYTASELIEDPKKLKEALDTLAYWHLSDIPIREWYYGKPKPDYSNADCLRDWQLDAMRMFLNLVPPPPYDG